MNAEELQAIKEQITFYKKHRKTLQFGSFYRIKNGNRSVIGTVNNPMTEYGVYQWIVVNEDKSTAIAMMLQELVLPNNPNLKLKCKGLARDKFYHFTNRKLKFNIKEFGDLINTVSPVHVKKDSVMHNVIAKFVKMDGETEEYTVSGAFLNHVGIQLKQGFAGVGYDDQVRLFQDFGARIYVMEEV